MGDGVGIAVLADAEDFSTGAEVAGGSVVEGVVLEGAGGLDLKAEGEKAGLEGCGIGDGELYFDLGVRHGVSIRRWRHGRDDRMEIMSGGKTERFEGSEGDRAGRGDSARRRHGGVSDGDGLWPGRECS